MNFIKTNLSFFHYILLFACFSLSPLDAFEVQNIPVQSEGRIKPLDTFARNMLLRFYGKREIKDQNIKASDWLLDLILTPENGRNLKVFNIRNPEVVSSLFLEWSTQHKYSFNEIINGIKNQVELIKTIDQKESQDRTPFEQQLLELSQSAIMF